MSVFFRGGGAALVRICFFEKISKNILNNITSLAINFSLEKDWGLRLRQKVPNRKLTNVNKCFGLF